MFYTIKWCYETTKVLLKINHYKEWRTWGIISHALEVSLLSERGSVSDDNSKVGDPGYVGRSARPHPTRGVRDQLVYPGGDARALGAGAGRRGAARRRRVRRQASRSPLDTQHARLVYTRLRYRIWLNAFSFICFILTRFYVHWY